MKKICKTKVVLSIIVLSFVIAVKSLFSICGGDNMYGSCEIYQHEEKKETKTFCPKCGSQVEKSQLIKPKKEEIKLRSARNEEIGKKVFCPVMKKEFGVSNKTKVVDYNGKSYYLCCGSCEKAILKNPEKYISICPKCSEQVNPEKLKQKPVKSTEKIGTKELNEKIIYTCPMYVRW
jgi:YHS domain-containing protein